MSSSNCCFLICIQISQEAGKVVCYSHVFKNFPQFVVIHTVKGFGIVHKAEIDVFLELFCFFDDPVDLGNFISGSSAFSKSILNIWNSRFMYCWSLAWRILSITLLAQFWAHFVRWFDHSLASFLWNWNENLCFPALETQATAEFSKFADILSSALSQHHILGFETAQLNWNSITSTSFVCSDAS